MYGSLSKYVEHSKWALADVKTLADGSNLITIPQKKVISSLFKRATLKTPKTKADAILIKISLSDHSGRRISLFQVFDQIKAYYSKGNDIEDGTLHIFNTIDRQGNVISLILDSTEAVFKKGDVESTVSFEEAPYTYKAFNTKIIQTLFRLL